MIKVYLAGPDVFYPNCGAIFEERIRLCAALGRTALIPVDETLDTAPAIFENNVALIEQADGIVANISPFRGPHCDVGTAWEMAYATAKGKPVFAWSSDPRPLVARIRAVGKDGRDAEGHLAENFGLAENLMIGESIVGKKAHATFEAAARAAAAHFKTQGAARKPARA
jgi:nucleoside 2-deoxyribosyltransferase